MHLNHLDEKVKCINKGVGETQGIITFTSDSDTTNQALASGEQCDNKVNVEVISLDTALHGECPSLIKIDVEGYETLVIKGAQETLKSKMLHAVIMELNGSGCRYGFDESKILELMFGFGFRAYSYNPLSRTLTDLEGKNLNSANTLFIRDKSFVQERLKVAPKVNINGREF